MGYLEGRQGLVKNSELAHFWLFLYTNPCRPPKMPSQPVQRRQADNQPFGEGSGIPHVNASSSQP
ncbi:hypothetical protein EYC56_22535 [Xanthomonas oryzae]|nr:hypothetical protein EYC54_21830 [Xanthomonas oryzae]QBH01521.1 hypothetical protein EYC56_22535 [Xanthomonas oryzae]QBH05397.1 hypothetical protein EYC57_21385 [Xanthomonas oryzae]